MTGARMLSLPCLSAAATGHLRWWLYGRHNVLEIVSWLAGVSQPHGGLTPELQQALLDLITTSDSLLRAAPLEPPYSQRLLKHLVTQAETSGQELCDELVEAYTKTLQAPRMSAGGDCSSRPSTAWMLRTVCYGPVLPTEAAPRPDCDCTHRAHTDTKHVPGIVSDLLTLQRHAERVQAVLQAHEFETAAAKGLPNIGAAAAAQAVQAAEGDIEDECSGCGGVNSGVMSLRVSSDLLQGGTGCADWEAGYVLSELLISRPQLVRGLRVVELGAGCGTAGIAAARAGASHVLLTDSGDPEALDNCALNCRLNGLDTAYRRHNLTIETHSPTATEPQLIGEAGSGHVASACHPRVSVGVLNWVKCVTSHPGSHSISDLSPLLGTYDVILASDVVYDPEVLPALVHTLKTLLSAGREDCVPVDSGGASVASQQRALSPPGLPYALIASTVRNAVTLTRFLALLEESGLYVETLTRGALDTDTRHSSAEQTATQTEESLLMATPVQFMFLPRVDAARARVAIHRVSCKREAR